jgi:uncharacterized small protein (DUF1192 family)
VPHELAQDDRQVVELSEKPEDIALLYAEIKSLRATIQSRDEEIRSLNTDVAMLLGSNRRREAHINVLITAVNDANLHKDDNIE